MARMILITVALAATFIPSGRSLPATTPGPSEISRPEAAAYYLRAVRALSYPENGTLHGADRIVRHTLENGWDDESDALVPFIIRSRGSMEYLAAGARQSRCDFGTDQRNGNPRDRIPPLSIMKLGKMALLSAHYSLHRGDTDGAVSMMRTCMRFLAHTGSAKPLLFRMMTLALERDSVSFYRTLLRADGHAIQARRSAGNDLSGYLSARFTIERMILDEKEQDERNADLLSSMPGGEVDRYRGRTRKLVIGYMTERYLALNNRYFMTLADAARQDTPAGWKRIENETACLERRYHTTLGIPFSLEEMAVLILSGEKARARLAGYRIADIFFSAGLARTDTYRRGVRIHRENGRELSTLAEKLTR